MDKDLFGLILDATATSAGVFAMFLALRAYEIAKRQGRQNLELEILRDLATLLGDPGTEFDHTRALSLLSFIGMRYREGEMSAWRNKVQEGFRNDSGVTCVLNRNEWYELHSELMARVWSIVENR
ncbi:hypothetical protein [Plantactinospora soyae]|uniref:Uncharacterized protein n=1 Tax=Plantactinospora soyae TaxID=1544732 RepID=A0A927R548_9ACTN|nr:hypothetical protein [Plantactinospora soyae]MBE1485596.1 hypothetical protein [Plantactinospora soyae]